MTDLETGEQREAVFEQDRRGGPKPESHRGEPFVMVWMKDVRSRGLTATEIVVLDYLVKASDRLGVAKYRLGEIAALLGDVREQYVWRVIESLIAKDAAIRLARSEVVVNPYIMWQGHLADRSSAVIKWVSRKAMA